MEKLVFGAKENSSYYPTYVNFSIHYPNDWFFIKTDSNNWIVKGKEVPYKSSNGSIQFCINSKNVYTGSDFCKENQILEYRKATEKEIKEIKEMYKHCPFFKDKPKWEDFGGVSGYYVTSWCQIHDLENPVSNIENKNVFPSKKEAEACLALSQLLQWRDKYNGEPLEKWCDWNNEFQVKYGINYVKNELESVYYNVTQHPLCFKSPFLRDKFIENFKELIEVAKPLL